MHVSGFTRDRFRCWELQLRGRGTRGWFRSCLRALCAGHVRSCSWRSFSSAHHVPLGRSRNRGRSRFSRRSDIRCGCSSSCCRAGLRCPRLVKLTVNEVHRCCRDAIRSNGDIVSGMASSERDSREDQTSHSRIHLRSYTDVLSRTQLPWRRVKDRRHRRTSSVASATKSPMSSSFTDHEHMRR